MEKWGPFVYINLTENSRENKEGNNKRLLSNDFEPVQKAIKAECGAFETGMHFVKRVIYDVESNWKVVNFFLALNILAQYNAMGQKTLRKSNLIHSL